MGDKYSDLEEKLETMYDKDNVSIYVNPSREEIDISIGKVTECLSVTIIRDTNVMELLMLHKCGDLSGEYHLKKMIKLAAYYKNTIRLQDASYIEYYIPYEFIDGERMIRISLHMMNILETGKSWYQRHGFKPFISEYDTFDYSSINIDDLIKTFIKQNVKDFIHPHDKDYRIIIEELKDDPEFDEDTIKISLLMSKIKTYLKLTCPNGKCSKPFFTFVDACKNIIEFLYNYLVTHMNIPKNYLIDLELSYKEHVSLGKKTKYKQKRKTKKMFYKRSFID